MSELDYGKLWSFLRNRLQQGMNIEQDARSGAYQSYEHLSARLDEAAREQVTKFKAQFPIARVIDESCAHADTETFIVGDCGAVQWCRVCGALRDDDGWRAPSRVDEGKD